MKRKGQQTNVGNSEKVEISPNSGVNVKKKKFRFLSNNRLLKASQQEVSAAKASKDSKDLVESDSGDAKLTLCMDAKNAVPRGKTTVIDCKKRAKIHANFYHNRWQLHCYKPFT